MKKVLAVILCVVTLLSQLAVVSLSANDPVLVDFSIDNVSVIDGVDGYIEYYYDDEGNEYEYFYYEWEYTEDVWVKLYYSDGSEVEYPLWFLDFEVEYENPQSYENQWTLGNTYEASLTIEGITHTVQISVVENPVASIQVLEVASLIEGIDGYMDYDFDEFFNAYEYFRYDTSLALKKLQVTYTDGTTEILPEEEMFWLYIEDDQNYGNQWTVGTYSATVHYQGRTCEFPVEIIPNTIESIEVEEALTYTEYRDGSYTFDYDDDFNEVMYFQYNTLDAVVSLKVTHNDGTSEIVSPLELSSFEVIDDQAYDNQWTAGDHTVTVSYAGSSCEFVLTIEPNGIESIEVLEAISLQEETDGYYDYGEDIHGIEREYFSYDPERAIVKIKETYTDGEVIVRYYNELLENFPGVLYTDSEQSYTNQWKAGGTYTATLHMYGTSCEYDVKIEEPCDYKFDVIDGELYINGWSEKGLENRERDLIIPAELFGYPVVGINFLESKTIKIKTITIPDSVYYIGPFAFTDIDTLEKVVIGKNVANVTAGAFAGLKNLTAIEADPDNADYASVDGVLFNKEITSLVAYPEGKGSVYTLPVTLKDLYAINNYEGVEFIVPEDSEYFTVQDGVVFTKDMKTLVKATEDLSGYYVMPHTVEFVDAYAFAGCTELEHIIFSNAVTDIGEGAFTMCSSLTAVLLPKNLVSLGDAAFLACTSLKGVIVQENLEYLGMMAFVGAAEDFKVHYRGTEDQWNEFEISFLDELLAGTYEVVYYDEDELIPHVLNGRIVTTTPGAAVMEPLDPIKLDEKTGVYMGIEGWIIKGAEDDVVQDSYKFLYAPEDSAVMLTTYFVLGNVDNDAENIVAGFDVTELASLIKNDTYSKYGDLDFDGKLTASDSIILMQIIKGSYKYE